MAYNATTGKWDEEDATVSTRVTGLMSKNSPFMQQAKTQATKASNRRGLMNSSMAVTAGLDSGYRAAVPIASQDASQAHQRNMQERDIANQTNIAGMNIAAHDREKSASMATALENSYAEMFRTIGQQHELPSDVRDKYLAHIGAIRDSNMNLVSQMYGIQLTWDSPEI